MTPIVISAPSGQPPMSLLDTIPAGRPVLTLTTPEWEIDHLRRAMGVHKRFVFLKDSVTIHDPGLFLTAIDTAPAPGAWLFARPSCYLAVYDAEALNHAIRGTIVRTKEESIWQESRLHDLLAWPSIWPDVSDVTALGIDAGELVIGNEIVTKRKGTARCVTCAGIPRPGLCEHYLQRFGVAV